MVGGGVHRPSSMLHGWYAFHSAGCMVIWSVSLTRQAGRPLTGLCDTMVLHTIVHTGLCSTIVLYAVVLTGLCGTMVLHAVVLTGTRLGLDYC